jgi:multiple sugar transport system permease protein
LCERHVAQGEAVLFKEVEAMKLHIKWNTIIPYLLIMPNVLMYAVFVLIPVVCIFLLSFTDYTILNPGGWVGLQNYKRLISDSIFHQAVINTSVYWFFTVVPTMLIGLAIAALLNTGIRAQSIFRAAIFLPGVISSVAIAMTWLWLLDPMQGPVNAILEWFGGQGRSWLQDPDTALPSIIVIGIWSGIGFSMLIYLAGLQGIPEHLYEAASIDGAGLFRKFIWITIPMLRPITFFLFITTTIRSFQVFDLVFILTNGGPMNSTTTIVNEVVKTAFQDYRMGYAAALSIFLLILTLIITMVNYKVGSERGETE